MFDALTAAALADQLSHELDNGRIQWTADLPPGHDWRVRAGTTALLAWPALPAPLDPLDRILPRAVESFLRCPAAHRLPALALGVYDAWAARTVPVLILEPATGRVRQRLDLAAGPVVALHADAAGAVVVTAGRAYWLDTIRFI